MRRIIKIIFFLLLVECSLQLVSFARYIQKRNEYTYDNPLISNWYLAKNENRWWNVEFSTIARQYNPFTEFLYKDIHTPHINYDVNGVRFTVNNASSDSQDITNVWFFGGSTLAGWAIADSDTIPSYSAKILNAQQPRYSVSNYGQFGYNLNQELQLLILQLKSGRTPDIAVFYDGCNEFYVNRLNERQETFFGNILAKEFTKTLSATHFAPGNNSLINKNAARNAVRWVGNYIKIIHYPVVMLSRIFSRPDKIKNLSDIPTNDDIPKISSFVTDNYVKNVIMIQKLAHEYGFSPVFVWQPLIFHKPLTDEEKHIFRQYSTDVALYNRITASVVQQNLEGFIDLSTLFINDSSHSFFMDNCHLDPSAHTLIAEHITEKIIQIQK